MFTCLLRGRSTPEIRAIDYPCLCLCFEFEQITRTTPRRCTILHLSQIFFTDALTFMIADSFFALRSRVLLVTVDDASASQVVRRKLHRDLVPRQDTDKVLAHPP